MSKFSAPHSIFHTIQVLNTFHSEFTMCCIFQPNQPLYSVDKKSGMDYNADTYNS